MRLEKQNIPSSSRTKVNQRFRNHESDVDKARRRLRSLAEDRAALFGSRYTDDPASGGAADAQLEQRQQLLAGTERVSPELVARWGRGRRMFNAYGPTEATVNSTLGESHPDRLRGTSVPIGVADPMTTAHVLDDRLAEAEEGAADRDARQGAEAADHEGCGVEAAVVPSVAQLADADGVQAEVAPTGEAEGDSEHDQ